MTEAVIVIVMLMLSAATMFVGKPCKRKLVCCLTTGFAIGTWVHGIAVKDRLDRLKAIETAALSE